MQKDNKKEFYGSIDYIDLYYDQDNEQIIIRSDRNQDNTFICLNIDLYNFVQCVNKSDLNRFKKQLINNIKSL